MRVESPTLTRGDDAARAATRLSEAATWGPMWPHLLARTAVARTVLFAERQPLGIGSEKIRSRTRSVTQERSDHVHVLAEPARQHPTAAAGR